MPRTRRKSAGATCGAMPTPPGTATPRPKPGAGRAAATLAREALPPAADLEARLGETRTQVADDRGRLAQARAEAHALAREAEIAESRLAAIASEAAAWSGR